MRLPWALEVPVREHFSTLVRSPSTNVQQKGAPSSPEGYFSTPACLDQFSEVSGHDRDHGVLAPLLSPGLHVIASNINEITGLDLQVQLPAYIRLEGMDQVRSDRKFTCDGHYILCNRAAAKKDFSPITSKTEMKLSRWSLLS